MRLPSGHRASTPRLLASLVSLLLIGFLATGCGGNPDAPGGANAQVSSAQAGNSDTAASPLGCPSSNTTNFAKTKFVLHTGLAFGAFHRYLYKPFRAGTFQSGAHGRALALVKAGAAALFIKREVRLATEDVKANPTLCRSIGEPLQQIGERAQEAVSGLKSGDFSALSALEDLVGKVESKASSAGTPIQENNDPPLS
jgi:hypothetical protein